MTEFITNVFLCNEHLEDGPLGPKHVGTASQNNELFMFTCAVSWIVVGLCGLVSCNEWLQFHDWRETRETRKVSSSGADTAARMNMWAASVVRFSDYFVVHVKTSVCLGFEPSPVFGCNTVLLFQ